jgi:hypothetical protein
MQHITDKNEQIKVGNIKVGTFSKGKNKTLEGQRLKNDYIKACIFGAIGNHKLMAN